MEDLREVFYYIQGVWDYQMDQKAYEQLYLRSRHPLCNNLVQWYSQHWGKRGKSPWDRKKKKWGKEKKKKEKEKRKEKWKIVKKWKNPGKN